MAKSIAISAMLWLAGLAGAGMFGYSLTQQTAIQLQMNQTMKQINQSIATSKKLTQQTSVILQPLVGTTEALAGIEQLETQSLSDIESMNNHLRDIAKGEQGIITGLDHLNVVTDQARTGLIRLASLNGQLLDANQQTASMAAEEATRVSQLNSMTETTIAQMHQLNQKFAALKMVP
ncbi:MAG: hypothetical protein IRZ10_08120 [Thermoflavifilum sp.]|nr:hypothetical protein [Thermoflavifilum sp.]MCL6514377.1 hypothetical protein [Alicyclobacillus sp.]